MKYCMAILFISLMLVLSTKSAAKSPVTVSAAKQTDNFISMVSMNPSEQTDNMVTMTSSEQTENMAFIDPSEQTDSQDPAHESEQPDNQDIVSTAEELDTWLRSHQETGGSVILAANISLLSTDTYYTLRPITIETGSYSLAGISFNGPFTFCGTGTDQPVLKSANRDFGLSLTQNNGGCTVIARGTLEKGGTAIYSDSSVSLDSALITANGPGSIAVHIQNGQLNCKAGSIIAEGENSRAIFWENIMNSNDSMLMTLQNRLEFSRIHSSGNGALSIDCPISLSWGLTENDIFPEFIHQKSNLTMIKADEWNRKSIFQSAASQYLNTGLYNVWYVSTNPAIPTKPVYFSLPVEWDAPSPTDANGNYTITGHLGNYSPGTVSVADEIVYLTVRSDNQPELSAAIPSVNDDGASVMLRCSGYSHTYDLWGSDNQGLSWKKYSFEPVNNLSEYIQIGDTDKKTNIQFGNEYIFFLENNPDSSSPGLRSDLFYFTIHDNGNYIWNTGENASVINNLDDPDYKVSTIKELTEWINFHDEKNATVHVQNDLIISDIQYLDSNPRFFEIGTTSIDMGPHSIVIKEGGTLFLNVNELYGEGARQPLIKVKNKGRLILMQSFSGQAPFLREPYTIRSEGDGMIGGTTISLDPGSTFSAEYVEIIAEGNHAKAIESLDPNGFSLPATMYLSVSGTDSTALSCVGTADIFYSTITARGQNARSVEALQVNADSSYLDPLESDFITTYSKFVDFNIDIDQLNVLPLDTNRIDAWITAPDYIYITVAKAGDRKNLKSIPIMCKYDFTQIDTERTGKYPLPVLLETISNLPIHNLPKNKILTVGVQDRSIPDISLIKVFSPIWSPFDDESLAKHNIRIDTLHHYSSKNSKIWYSTDYGLTWKNAAEDFSVLYNNSSIYIGGLTSEVNYLLQLEADNTSNNISEEQTPNGYSIIQKLFIEKDNNITVYNWFGSRGDGDRTDQELPPVVIETENKRKPDITVNTKPIPSVTNTQTIIPGTMLNQLIKLNHDTILFEKKGISIYLPKDFLENLKLSENDILAVTIKSISENSFYFGVTVNGKKLNKLTKISVQLPTGLSILKKELYCYDQNGSLVSEAMSDSDLGIVSFTITDTGTFYIQESPDTTSIRNASGKPRLQSCMTKPGMISFLFIIFFLLSYVTKMKKRY